MSNTYRPIYVHFVLSIGTYIIEIIKTIKNPLSVHKPRSSVRARSTSIRADDIEMLLSRLPSRGAQFVNFQEPVNYEEIGNQVQ